MTPSNPDIVFADTESGFNSSDSEIIISDEPGDKTIRPLPPELMKWALALREKMARYREMFPEEFPDESTPNHSDK